MTKVLSRLNIVTAKEFEKKYNNFENGKSYILKSPYTICKYRDIFNNKKQIEKLSKSGAKLEGMPFEKSLIDQMNFYYLKTDNGDVKHKKRMDLNVYFPKGTSLVFDYINTKYGTLFFKKDQVKNLNIKKDEVDNYF